MFEYRKLTRKRHIEVQQKKRGNRTPCEITLIRNRLQSANLLYWYTKIYECENIDYC